MAAVPKTAKKEVSLELKYKALLELDKGKTKIVEAFQKRSASIKRVFSTLPPKISN